MTWGLLSGGVVFLLACTLAGRVVASEEENESVHVFAAVPVTDSGPGTDPSLALPFAQTALVLDCDTTPAATLSSTPDGTGGVVVDNFLTVNGVNVCTGRVDSGTLNNRAPSCFKGFSGNTGNALTSYTPVPPIDISGELARGRQLVTFKLMDWGFLLASSDIWLVTNCDVEEEQDNEDGDSGNGD